MKVILLPDKKISYFGSIINYNIFNNNINLCQLMISNKIYINSKCGGFGVCKTCKVFLIEGFFENNYHRYIKSCEIFNLKSNIIITT